MTQRVVIYARYSSELQRDASIDDQFRVCRDRAEREGWQVFEVFADHAISGATADRPGYVRLQEALRSRRIDIVLAESLDRLSRDQEHIAAFYKLVNFVGARIVTLAEGDISELHIGLKGTMGALYLKDLAQKTHRGIVGSIRQGRPPGHVPYGYQAVHQLDADGEPVRGLRQIDPAEAAVVRGIFRDYAAGISPLAIARALNARGIPGPSGGIWHDASIRGRPYRGDGLLRNGIYVGHLVWNRGHTVKDPTTGTRHHRKKDPADIVVQHVPELQIIDPALWDQVQARLARETAPKTAANMSRSAAAPASYRFWEHRRPKHLLTGKVVCGACGTLFATVGQDYLGCRAAKQGACTNTRQIRRRKLEAHVLDVLGRQLMDPDLVAAFVTTFSAEWNRIAAEHGASGERAQRELVAVQAKIDRLVDAISDGVALPEIRTKLSALEIQRERLEAEADRESVVLPPLDPDLAQVYREEVTRLKTALQGSDAAEEREAARELIDQIIVSPSPEEGEPPTIEVVGDFVAMLQAGGLGGSDRRAQAQSAEALRVFTSSAKVGTRGQSPP